jgi:hypothetical protein
MASDEGNQKNVGKSGVNKTLYIPECDASAWDDAKRYLAFYERRGISEVLNEYVVNLAKKLKARHDKAKSKP